jgi:hypothetical protein
MKQIRLLLLILLTSIVSETVYGQSIFTNPIMGTNPNTTNPYIAGQIVDPNITVSGIGRGTGISGTNANDRYNTNGWSTTVIDLTDYFEFTLTPNGGFKIDFASFVYTGLVSAGTPSFSFRSSIDGFTTNIGTPTAAGTTISLAGAAYQNITTATTFRLYAYGLTAATTTYSINDFTFNGIVGPSGPFSVTSGDWNVGSTWSTGTVPTSTDNATISATHVVYTNTNLTRSAITSVIGTFELRNGGYANGTNFNYNATSGTLNFNTSGNYGVNATDVYWPTTNPPFNVNVLQSGITLNAGANRVVGGIFSTASAGVFAINFPTATLTLNGTCRIDLGGAFGNAPIFGNTSTLIYNSGATYGRGLEWAANGVGVIGTTPGYPNNLQISNNTTIDYNNGTPSNKAIAGNLLIDAGSSLFLDFGPPLPSNGDLTVAGNVTNNGNFTLADDVGDDLYLGGNFVNTGVFNSNAKAIFFTKTGTQTVSSTNPLTFSYVVQQPASGANIVQLLSDLVISAPSAGNALTFSNVTDVFDINGRNLTIGTSGIANTILGLGSFRGSTTSNLSILGNGSIGDLRFATSLQLGSFTVNRTSAAIACVMTSPVTINTTLTLTNGIIDLGNNNMTIGTTATITGNSSSNYIIADVNNGINALLRKNFAAAGTFLYPIGDSTASDLGSQYSPITLAFTGGTYGGSAATAVEDIKNINLNASTDYITRYWRMSSTGISPASYTATANYLATDVVGTEANCISNQWNGLTWLNNGNNTGTNVLTLTGTTVPTTNHITKGLIDPEINIRQLLVNYLSGGTPFAFGARAVGSNTDIVFTIQNLGQGSLNLGAATITGGPEFSLFANYVSPVTGPSGTTTFTIRFSPTSIAAFTGSISIPNNDGSGSENPYIINFTGNGIASALSDLILVTGSPTPIISSTINDAVLTSTTGVQVMNFTIRDGGATAPDTDNLPTILTGFTISQSATDNVGIWSDGIQAISLFDGTTKLADGVVTATTVVFSGLNSTALDNGTKTLSLRLSLKCPLGTGALDGEDFGFSITNANTTFATTGSSKSAFGAVLNPNLTNVIQVVATQLSFSTQPISTGVGSGMSNVVVKATDLCGNTDLGFTGSVSLTSTGTMTGQPIVVSAIAGVATYTSIVHTVVATNLTMTASASGVSNSISANYDIGAITVLEKGDLAILAVNTTNTTSNDEFSFVCFKDILPGTQIYFTDNGYERVNAGQWGDTEGVFSITRSGTTLVKGTIVSIESLGTGGINDPTDFTVSSCGVVDTNWTKSVTSPSTVSFNLNKNDQIWITQGGVWANLDNAIAHNATYSGGNVLYGWTEIAWKTAPNYASTEGSTIFPGNRCYSTDVANTVNADAFVKFDDPVNPDFSSTTRDKIDWIAVINDPANWRSYADNATYNTIAANTNYNYKGSTTCPALTITAGTFVDGAWTGLKDTNWFNCNNWDTLEVPLATSNVTLITPKAIRLADISSLATDAALFGGIARCNNLTVSGQKVTLNGSINNKLEVNGNLIINGTGSIDMTDGIAGTPDGEITLLGNWTNSRGEGFFNEGEGTVIFKGATANTQNITCALGTPENFFNVTLDNTFTTDNFNSDLIAKGNLDIRPSKNLTVKTGHYALAGKNLTVGTGSVLEIEDDGSLSQTDDSGIVTNNGTTRVHKTTTPYVQYDYTYWCSPIKAETTGSVFAANPFNYIFDFTTANYLDLYSVSSSGGTGFPQVSGTPDTFDDGSDEWLPKTGASPMLDAKGYIAMGPTATGPTGQSVIFTESGANGRLNNGVVTVAVTKDKYNQDGLTGADTFHTNSNFIGNPYASAIDLVELKNDNPLLTGTFYFWTHKTPIAVLNPGPWLYNFTNNDYVTFTTGTGGSASSCSGCPVPDRYVDSCQGFFANVTDNGNITFNNSQRVTGNNASFYRSATSEDSKVWLNFGASNGETRQILVGFIDGAEDEYNPYYDGLRLENGSGFDFYSYIPSNPAQRLAVQGLAPFNDQKTVPLGLEIIVSGNHTISIANTEGVFNSGQAIYLQDNVTNSIHNFANGEYVFENGVGDAINDRFLLRFTDPSLGIANADLQNNNVIITSKNDKTIVKSNLLKIDKVLVYDILGRELLNKIKVNEFEFSINSNWSKQALIVKVVLENGEVVTKKIVN